MLTSRQQAVVQCIQRFIQTQGYPPTIREIGRELGIRSLRGVTIHLDALVRKGVLSRSRRARGLRLIDGNSPRAATVIPILGRVAAGQPLLAEGTIEEQMVVDPRFTPVPGCFVVRVHGQSMIGAGIHHGDYVVVQPQPDVANGAIVVVLVDGEATVKRLYRDRRTLRLQPDHPTMKPIVFRAGALAGRDVRIVGRVVGVMRKY